MSESTTSPVVICCYPMTSSNGTLQDYPGLAELQSAMVFHFSLHGSWVDIFT